MAPLRISLLVLIAIGVVGHSFAAQTATQTWAQRFSGTGIAEDTGRKVVVDNAGNVTVAGYQDAKQTGYDWLVIQYSSSGIPLWTNYYNGPGNSNDIPAAVTVDSGGNVFVTGCSPGVTGFQDILTIAYSSGGIPLWTNRFHGAGDRHNGAYGISTDKSGRIYVTGSASGPPYEISTLAYSTAGEALWTNIYGRAGIFGGDAKALAVDDNNGHVYVVGNSVELILVAYSTTGIPLWTNFYEGGGTAIAVGTNGDVYVTGTFSTDYATLAYTSNGTALWTNRYHGPTNGESITTGIALDNSGHIYVTGYSLGFGTSYDFATVAYSTAGLPLWTNRYNGPQSVADRANAVAVDSAGRVYVTGYSRRSASLDDYTTIAYTSAGVPLWTNLYDGTTHGIDQASAIAVDPAGNIIVTGVSYDGFARCVSIAYSSTGIPLWTNRFSGLGNDDDQPHAIAVDNNGNVFVTGQSLGIGTDSDYATIAYSSFGLPLWTNRYNGPGNSSDSANALALDSAGNVFVTGASTSASGSQDYFTVAYSSSGSLSWVRRYNPTGVGIHVANAIAVDKNGNVFVTGQSFNNTYDYATIAYANNGFQLWLRRYDGPALANDFATAIATDGSGNVYVTGYSTGNASGYDFATLAYSNSGLPLWTNRYGGPTNKDDVANAIAVDASGNIYVTGYSYGTSGYSDFATIAYSAAGMALWTNRYHGSGNGNDGANAIAINDRGIIYVTGYSCDTGIYSDFATLAYSTAGVPLWTNRYNGPGSGDDVALAISVDPGGNAVVAGRSMNTNTRDAIATVAYSSSGGPLWTNRFNSWPGGHDMLVPKSPLAVGRDGSVYVTAWSYGDFVVGPANAYDFVTVKYAVSPGFVTQPTNNSVIVGGAATFAVSAYGADPIYYQWLFNGVAIPGATNNFLTLSGVLTTDTGAYSVLASNAQGSAVSDPAQLLVGIPPQMLHGRLNPDRSITLDFIGTPGFNYVLQTATNLVPPIDWRDLSTNPAGADGIWIFVDPNTGDASPRFFRARLP